MSCAFASDISSKEMSVNVVLLGPFSTGTASSVAFTPLQGLEIVNPNAAESTKSQDGKYFSNNAGFLNVNNSQHK